MWLAATVAFVLGFIPCLIVAVRADAISTVAALNLAGVLATFALVTMTVAFQSQSFITLAVVLVPVSFVGSLAFVRYLEGQP
ncbi:MAG TPA: monovalent cation/H+ antiporter complex subunit F [Solirubrobacteraceae bacterium]|nr:monovalent cation/H+ antiporter complex subunit F [Solirubrobacteraceae bacterium]